MSNGMKLLLMAAGVVITCLVITVASQLAKTGKSDTQKATNQYEDTVDLYSDINLTYYDGYTPSGTEVVNFIKSCKPIFDDPNYSLSIVVKTKSNTTGLTYTSLTDSDASKDFTKNTAKSNSTGTNYINPDGKFACVVEYNKNGIVNKITFTQQ